MKTRANVYGTIEDRFEIENVYTCSSFQDERKVYLSVSLFEIFLIQKI